MKITWKCSYFARASLRTGSRLRGAQQIYRENTHYVVRLIILGLLLYVVLCFSVLLLDYSTFSITLPLEEPEQTADICEESLPSDRGVDVDVEPPVPRNKNNFSS